MSILCYASLKVHLILIYMCNIIFRKKSGTFMHCFTGTLIIVPFTLY